MKILQSFWSKPFQMPFDNSFDSRYMGGFPLKRHFIYTWALSILRLQEQFNEIHLVTDDFGKHLMIDVFGFPYSSSSTELNNLNEIPSKFWCAGKLYVFAKTKYPFLHFDGDVILGDLFDKEIVSNSIIAEYHYEDKPNMYGKVLKHIKGPKSSIEITPKIKEILNNEFFVYNDYNLGIIGGTNYEFLNGYAEESFKLIYQNLDLTVSNELPISFLNCFVDQFVFYNYAKRNKEKVVLCIKETFNSNYDYQAPILKQITTNFSFIHLHSTYKLNYYNLPELWLKHYYRDYYDKINLIIFGKTID